jgi:hypothetical protein
LNLNQLGFLLFSNQTSKQFSINLITNYELVSFDQPAVSLSFCFNFSSELKKKKMDQILWKQQKNMGGESISFSIIISYDKLIGNAHIKGYSVLIPILFSTTRLVISFSVL